MNFRIIASVASLRNLLMRFMTSVLVQSRDDNLPAVTMNLDDTREIIESGIPFADSMTR